MPSCYQLQFDKKRTLKSEGPNPHYKGSYHMLHYIDGELTAMGVLDVLDTMLISQQLLYHQKYKAISLGKLCIV